VLQRTWRGESFDARPALHEWRDKSELGALIVNEPQTNVAEVDVVYAVTWFDADQLALERMANGDERAPPPNAPACSDLASDER
jgi:hypothetical protein